MKIYETHLKAGAEPILVREGLAWGALVFGPIWLAFHRAWIPAAISLAAYILIGVLVPAPARIVLLIGLNFIIGLSGRDLVEWTLERRGYLLTHVLAARGADEALYRLLTYRPELAARFWPNIP